MDKGVDITAIGLQRFVKIHPSLSGVERGSVSLKADGNLITKQLGVYGQERRGEGIWVDNNIYYIRARD